MSKGKFSSIYNNQTQDLNTQISMLDVLHKFGIEVRQTGTKYNCLCPLHGDKDTASFFIYPETNSWTCFGANCYNPNNSSKRNGGDVVEFVMQYKHLDYWQALQWLDKNFALSVRKKEPIRFKHPKELPKIADETIAYYHSLLDATNSRDYFLQRGLTNKTINEQALGFDGENHVIPIWENEPRVSDCLCIKLRTHETKKPKYIRFGSYKPHLYNVSGCKNKAVIYMFAGELDALLAYQDGLPACSIINGAKSISELGTNWPNRFFPKASLLIIIFDRKEDIAASFVAREWDKWKGKFCSQIFQWPYFGGKDYTDYRIKYNHSFQEFRSLLNA